MERRKEKYGLLSPERAKVWTEKSPKYHHNYQYSKQQHERKVPVVYYLCKNRQLEHPHFMEVPLSSADGLFLRDVIERLNALRGRGMASMYSWSCKRSYKNGFVWYDLSDNDLILPAQGNEYVLKGSELFEESNSGRFSQTGALTFHNQKALPEPPPSRSQEESFSSSSQNGRITKISHEDASPVQHPCLLATSPELSSGKNSPWNGSLSLTEYKIYRDDGLADASTQTAEKSGRTTETRNICINGVSVDDGSLDSECIGPLRNQIISAKETLEICRDFVSPPSTSSTSSSGRTDTLEALIRADAKKLKSFRILEEEDFRISSSTKATASNMILQLISCGSISVKDHSFGLIPTYKPRFSHSRFSSPFLATSLILGEPDQFIENPRVMGMRVEDKEYFSGSFVETSMFKEGIPTIKKSSSYNADRSSQHIDLVEMNEEESFTRLKCLPKSIKASLSKQPRCESKPSPISEGPRISSDRVESSRSFTAVSSNGGSKRITEDLLGKCQSPYQDSCRNKEENLIKIEESLLQELGL